MILMLETLGKVRVMLKYTQAQTLVQSIPLPALEYGWAPKVLLSWRWGHSLFCL